MSLSSEESFEYNGQTFEIRLVADNGKCRGAAYSGEMQVTGFHTVSHWINDGFSKRWGSYLLLLIQDVKDDICNGQFLQL